jgi:hypothetical protein
MQILGWLARFYGQDRQSSGRRSIGVNVWGRVRPRSKRRSLGLESLEARCVLAEDFGDAPDTGNGVGAGNYRTLLTDNGPRHTIVAGLFLGAGVDGEADATPNGRANGDDSTSSPDDEDGVVNPLSDLVLTIGTQPTITLLATNTLATNATLSGWIDYNANGVFDNGAERARVSVPAGSNNGTFTLVFPVVPAGFTGTSYARFRLSTDLAGQDSENAASDGEVEDYVVTITGPGAGTVKSGGATKLASGGANMPTLVDSDMFGSAIANLGDLDGDGVSDLAVGAIGDDSGGASRGAVHVLFLNANGSIKSSTKIASGLNGGPTITNADYFGSSIANLGDLDGDGVVDLAVGAYSDETGGANRGAVYVLFLNADGTAKSNTKIASGVGGGPTLVNGDGFGLSAANLGDLDGDGISDLAVGAFRDGTGGPERGAVHILFLNRDGTVKSGTKVASGANGGPTLADNDLFGASVANVGDLNGDGLADLAVGANRDDTGGTDRGAVHILFLNANGSVKSTTKISSGVNGAPTLANSDAFGSSMTSPGDLDGDGVADLAVGAFGDDTAGNARGALHVLFLNPSGTVKSTTKIASGLNGGPSLLNDDRFGIAVASLGDLDGDGVVDLSVGAYYDDTNGTNRGAVHLLRLNTGTTLRDFGDAPDTGAGTGARNYETLNASGGPSHAVVNGLLLGTRISGETDATQNTRANGDDIGTADEDGVVNEQADFLLTVGTQPIITLRATNTTGTAATLSGWIDYNNNGVFDSVSERAQVTVGAGIGNETFTLVFPVVPTGFTGTTYARFRLGTDLAAQSPTGASNGGEVEDYVVTITGPSTGSVKTGGATKIASGSANLGTLANNDLFGVAVANLGDLDGDGVADLAVGAYDDDTGGSNRGAVHVLFLNADGSVKSSTKIAHGLNGGPTLANGDAFGFAMANVGDLDGDGIADLAVGAIGDDTGGSNRGAVHILFLNAGGTVKSSTKIASGLNGAPTLANYDNFGRAVANVGDLDGDGVVDLAAGASGDDTGGSNRGAVHILFLNAGGTVKSSTKIASGLNGTPTLSDGNSFGVSAANLGDLDGDGVADLAVGALGDDTGGSNRGAVHILFLNANGSVKSSTKIASGLNGAPTLSDGNLFGVSAANLGDLDGDGVADLAVGATSDATGGANRGAVHILFLSTSGTVRSSTKIASGLNGGPTLNNGDYFGRAVANLGDLDGDGVIDLAVGATNDDTGGAARGALYILRLNTGTALRDFGDAPDTGAGTGVRDYETLNASGGPSHSIVNGLLLGSRISGETDATQNSRANGDDIGTDDEDGVVNPHADFLLTVGAQPTITLRATNTTGMAATLSGWIDYNNNGAFDSATERAQISVPAGTNNGTFTLVFPAIPTGFTGATYARFRLSTDAAGQNPTGAATNGEVEDYVVTITGPGSGTVKTGGATKLASGGTNMPTLTDHVNFGSVVESLGDLDGDGVTDLAVRALSEYVPDEESGAIHILLLNANGTVKSSTKIASGLNGGPTLAGAEYFGNSLANVGDLDGDGVVDLAVGATHEDTGGSDRGAVYILFLNTNGTVKSSTKIASGLNGGPTLGDFENFGSAVDAVGDLDGDGVADLAVGVYRDNTGGPGRGAIHVLFLTPNGTAKSSTKIASGLNGGPALANYDRFGKSVANLGDLDGDGVVDLAVGATHDDTGGSDRGAVYILFLNANGTVKSSTKIASGTGGGPTLANSDNFGNSVANVGDLDGDGVADLAVGAVNDDTGGTDRGAVHVLFLKTDGTVKSSTKIASGTGGGPTLANYDNFGSSLANLGDLDGDGVVDLAVGTSGDDTGGTNRGAVHILRLNLANRAPTALNLSANTIAENSVIGSAIGTLSTTDPDAGNTFTYSLLNPGVNVDNQAFSIVENQLQSFAVFNFEAKSSYSVVVRTTDQGGLFFDQTFTVTVTNVNETPTALNLSANTIAENSASGTAIGTFTTTDPDASNTFTYTLLNPGVNVDNQAFSIVGNQLQSSAVFNFEAKSSYSVVVRTTDQGGLFFDRTFTVNITDVNEVIPNTAPALDSSGNPFAILGAGSRQSTEMRQGTLVSDLLARGAGGNPISDPDAGAQRGIALTAVDQSLGNFQYTLVTNNPQESDWVNVDAAGAISNTSALLLPTTARLRFTTGRIPHHASAPFFLSVESKLDAGLTFRAWDRTTGTAGGRADTSTNGGSSAFSSATETSKVYFEVRLFRSFNPNASLNVYTLEAEFNALTGGAFQDRSTSAYTGFTVLLSAVPELGTSALFRLYFGIQFNDDGTETDMGYRYLTSNAAEATFLESIGPASKRPQREGTYFRELGVSDGTATIGYVFTTQQPGTSELTQIYRTDVVNKPTRPPGTSEGGTPTSFKPQENGDHVYTTNTAFETTKFGTWRIESTRGFVRELNPNPVAGAATVAAAESSELAQAGGSQPTPAPTSVRSALPVSADSSVAAPAILLPATGPTEQVARLVATPSQAPVLVGPSSTTEPTQDVSATAMPRSAASTSASVASTDTDWSDAAFADLAFVTGVLTAI